MSAVRAIGWMGLGGPGATALALACATLVFATPAWTGAPVTRAPVRSPEEPAGTAVRVERVRPKTERHVTLRFLKENRDFIRTRVDRLRSTPEDVRLGAQEIDPRFLAYRQMMREALASGDSLAAAEDRTDRSALLASVTELGTLEQRLDRMEALLAAQRLRLGMLQQDFTGRQQTALAIIVTGQPGAAVSSVWLRLEGGGTHEIPISDGQRESLRHGGILRIYQGLVEPRRQVLEIGLAFEGRAAGDSGFVTLEPVRDRLTFLRLDLSPAVPAEGAAGILASTWIHEARLEASESPGSHP